MLTHVAFKAVCRLAILDRRFLLSRQHLCEVVVIVVMRLSKTKKSFMQLKSVASSHPCTHVLARSRVLPILVIVSKVLGAHDQDVDAGRLEKI